jgi:hypothetical protein
LRSATGAASRVGFGVARSGEAPSSGSPLETTAPRSPPSRRAVAASIPRDRSLIAVCSGGCPLRSLIPMTTEAAICSSSRASVGASLALPAGGPVGCAGVSPRCWLLPPRRVVGAGASLRPRLATRGSPAGSLRRGSLLCVQSADPRARCPSLARVADPLCGAPEGSARVSLRARVDSPPPRPEGHCSGLSLRSRCSASPDPTRRPRRVLASPRGLMGAAAARPVGPPRVVASAAAAV